MPARSPIIIIIKDKLKKTEDIFIEKNHDEHITLKIN